MLEDHCIITGAGRVVQTECSAQTFYRAPPWQAALSSHFLTPLSLPPILTLQFDTPTIASSVYLFLHSTMNEFIYRDTSNLPSRDDVIAACAKKVDEVRHLTYLSKDRKFFIKYGFSAATGEAKT